MLNQVPIFMASSIVGVLLGMLAQTSDPISGGAGWAGAGLLGLVLCWLLFKHLPAKDAQLKEFVTAKDAAAVAASSAFHVELATERRLCKEGTDSLLQRMDADRISHERRLDAVAMALGEIKSVVIKGPEKVVVMAPRPEG